MMMMKLPANIAQRCFGRWNCGSYFLAILRLDLRLVASRSHDNLGPSCAPALSCAVPDTTRCLHFVRQIFFPFVRFPYALFMCCLVMSTVAFVWQCGFLNVCPCISIKESSRRFSCGWKPKPLYLFRPKSQSEAHYGSQSSGTKWPVIEEWTFWRSLKVTDAVVCMWGLAHSPRTEEPTKL